ncbi:alpha/beta fold hydrolase [Chryseosolibacter indicus]|uniref:Alpha/beta hydrolase n=1 Tax=Chryseosolibacter indicus TaxID=2782351 RepID=A0ABS5VSS3_9BACT|nr:alpha/beta hydrolase [Chryseosolibacter indicus]MBT1703919.1 alpha/beta hydrolase [Chryseosolibacter indicus]
MNIFKEPLFSQSYIDTGEGQPVILLHGLFGNIAMWRTTINTLKHRYRVVVPRLPLFEVPIHRANVDYLVEVFHEFLLWHNLNNIILVGTDIGGQLALDYAYHYPENVKKVIISGCSGLFENIPPINKADQIDYDSVEDQVKDAFYKRDIVGTTMINKVYNTVNASSKNLHISAFASSSKKSLVSKFLFRVSRPVLMIWGLQDKITPPEVALHFHDLLRYGTIKFIDECGHYPMIEKPESYNEALLEFLN